jgi:two-component system sensor histidine kinase CpxA
MRLFTRIFASFFAATILMVVALLGVSDFIRTIFPGDGAQLLRPDLVEAKLSAAIDSLEQSGSDAAFQDIGVPYRGLYLMDSDEAVLIKKGPAPPFYLPLAQGALNSGHTEVLPLPSSLEFACALKSHSGKRYVVVLRIPETFRFFRVRFWLDLGVILVPMSLVCLILSLYLTRPIMQLKVTAQRLAAGDLSARIASREIARHDELGDLGREFNTMAAQIQLLMTAQKRLVADVSHELGGPLTRMHLALALLRRRLKTERPQELDRIEYETDQLSNMVQQLLLVARMEAGSCLAETLAPLSIKSLCESAVEDASFEADHAGCTITGCRQDIILMGFPQLLRRAIDNILRNAIHHAPSGSEIVVNCNANLHDVTVEVLDSGPGVPESMLSEIFEPFFRTTPGRDSDSGGTGLGLAIAREAVRLHEGTIAAFNRPTRGLHVTIKLPMRTVFNHEPS